MTRAAGGGFRAPDGVPSPGSRAVPALEFLLRVLLFLVDTATWLILGRLLVQPLIRNPKGSFWQVFLIATEPVLRVSRALTAGRVPEKWIWLVSLVWLMIVRIVVKLELRP